MWQRWIRSFITCFGTKYIGRLSAVVNTPWFPIALSALAALVSLVTFLALNGRSFSGSNNAFFNFQSNPKIIQVLLVLDLLLVVGLVVYIAAVLYRSWIKKKRGSKGSRLHGRFLLIVSLFAGLPAVIVALFSFLFFNLGLETWFNDNIKNTLDRSLVAAKAYLKEHEQSIRGDILGVSSDVYLFIRKTKIDPLTSSSNAKKFNDFFEILMSEKYFSEAVIFFGNRKSNVLARSSLSYGLATDHISPDIILKADLGELVLFPSKEFDRMRALIKLEYFAPDVFLYMERAMDPSVLEHIRQMDQQVKDYQKFEKSRFSIQVTFSLVYAAVTLLLMLAAVGVGLQFATKLIGPIGHLIDASEKIALGDFSARVNVQDQKDEMAVLGHTFNRMVQQLQQQHQELIKANLDLDEKGRFLEAVLAGVSVGVVGMDKDGIIHLANKVACDWLGLVPASRGSIGGDESREGYSPETVSAYDFEEDGDYHIKKFLPGIDELIGSARQHPEQVHELQLTHRYGSKHQVLHLKMMAELDQDHQNIVGFVLTMDDMSDLIGAQRLAAWSDVARRIAHEIKNPLTPIQLSAERLARKFGPQIQKDQEVFTRAIDTIVRHVGDIGRMVDEFSAFARMPKPVFQSENIVPILKQWVEIQQETYVSTVIRLYSDIQQAHIECDQRLLQQALSNLMLNAVQSIQERQKEEKGHRGRVELHITQNDDKLRMIIDDNGMGFPESQMAQLMEPYVTTKDKGTGLGLAIVKKIIEEHRATIHLENIPDGARVIVEFPMMVSTQKDDAA